MTAAIISACAANEVGPDLGKAEEKVEGDVVPFASAMESALGKKSNKGGKTKMTSPYEESIQLEVGDKAPLFTGRTHPNGQVALEDFAGKKNVVLAFYPKDDTPGCTKEMCSFSDDRKEFEALDTVVFGISCDSIDSHSAFASKYGLGLELIDDSSREIGKSYGAVRGDRLMADRILFLIDKQGIIKWIHEGMPSNQELLVKIRALSNN